MHPLPRMISFVIMAQKHEHNLVSDVESLILDSIIEQSNIMITFQWVYIVSSHTLQQL